MHVLMCSEVCEGLVNRLGCSVLALTSNLVRPKHTVHDIRCLNCKLLAVNRRWTTCSSDNARHTGPREVCSPTPKASLCSSSLPGRGTCLGIDGHSPSSRPTAVRTTHPPTHTHTHTDSTVL